MVGLVCTVYEPRLWPDPNESHSVALFPDDEAAQLWAVKRIREVFPSEDEYLLKTPAHALDIFQDTLGVTELYHIYPIVEAED